MRNSQGIPYTYAAESNLLKEDEESKLHRFFMGLNEAYIGFRSNLLMMQLSPSLDTAYSILFQDERQRQASPSNLVVDTVSFNVNFSNKSPNPARHYFQKVNFDQNKSTMYCKYGKKQGHLIEKYYKLHGFLSNFKFTKGLPRRTAASVEVQNPDVHYEGSNFVAEGCSSSSDFGSLIPGLTKDQCTQLLLFLQ